MKIEDAVSLAKKDSDISPITRVQIRIGNRYDFSITFEELDEAINYGRIW